MASLVAAREIIADCCRASVAVVDDARGDTVVPVAVRAVVWRDAAALVAAARVVVARDAADCVVVVVLVVPLARVVEFDAGFSTVVRAVVVRSVLDVVEIRCCVVPLLRVVAVVPSRTAASASPMHNAANSAKIRISFISDKILAKFGK